MAASILPKITGPLPSIKFQSDDWLHIEAYRLPLADPEYTTPAKIDVLIGADEITSILKQGLIVGPKGTPAAQEMILGWVLFEKVDYKPESATLTYLGNDAQLENLIYKSWDLEMFQERSFLKPDELACEKLFVDTHQRDSEGRFIVALLFIKDAHLGVSRHMALRSWINMERRLKRNYSHREQYHAFFQDMLDQGHMEPGSNANAQGYYMPHHSFTKETSGSTKTRVVFNASTKLLMVFF